MGGERETTSQGTSKVGGEFKVANLRIHESSGEVHFHDDKNKLKAAVPVRSWYPACEKLISGTYSFAYIDPDNNVLLRATSVWDDALQTFDIEISLSPIKVGDMASKLIKFTFNK